MAPFFALIPPESSVDTAENLTNSDPNPLPGGVFAPESPAAASYGISNSSL
jgi:hypothetical protein